MSFLEKLKVKVDQGEPVKEAKTDDNKKKQAAGFLQLDVDIYQTSTEIVIIAPIPGVEVRDLDISIENENDVVTIQGRRDLPVVEDEGDENRQYLRQENQWGQFYRQIILPQEINVAEVEAKFKKGVLVLRLPMLRLQNNGRKKVEISS